jgi:hypothetical protein
MISSKKIWLSQMLMTWCKQLGYKRILVYILLTLIFWLLDFLNVINWHWYWIISPLWIPLGFITLSFIVTLIVLYIYYLMRKQL